MSPCKAASYFSLSGTKSLSFA